MKLSDIRPLTEASYKGNIGMMEMFKFYQVATTEQKQKMKSLIEAGKQEEAWEFLQQVTGVKLKEAAPAIECFRAAINEVRVGELIPLAGTNYRSTTMVPAGKAAKAEFGVVGVSLGIKDPKGPTSKSVFGMPKYKTINGKTQGVK